MRSIERSGRSRNNFATLKVKRTDRIVHGPAIRNDDSPGHLSSIYFEKCVRQVSNENLVHKWIPTYRLAGTNRSHYAARSSPILMARRKSDRFATCASNSRFHARSQIVLIFRDPSASRNDVLSLILLLDKYRFFTIFFLFSFRYLFDKITKAA